MVTEWSEITWRGLWLHATTARADLPYSFYIMNFVAVALLALGVYGFSELWDRYFDARFGRWIDKYLDVMEIFTKPLDRLLRRLIRATARRTAERLPLKYRDDSGAWRLLFHAGIALAVCFLALQFYSMASYAASTKGLHRTEVPFIIAGAVRAEWGCSWLRLQDGALPMRLASIPLPLANRTLSATYEDRKALCNVDDGAAIWSLARSVLWGRQITDGTAAELITGQPLNASALDDLVSAARSSSAFYVGLPLLFLNVLVSWSLWGPTGALLSAALTTFCPAHLAHTPLLTSDAPAVLLLHSTLWSLWATLHATSTLYLLITAITTAVLFGLLLSSGPLAALFIPAAILMLAIRLMSGFRQLARAVAFGSSRGWQWAQILRMSIASLLSVLALPTISGLVASAVAALPIRLIHEADDEEEAAWASAASRLAGPSSLCGGKRRRKKKSTKGRSKKGGSDAVVDPTSEPSPPLPPNDCFKSRGVAGPLLVSGCEYLAATTLVPKLLLVLSMQHAAAVAELTRSGGSSSEWGSPNDAGDGNALVYRSGVHAYRHEAYTDDEQVPPPLASLHLMIWLLKTSQVLMYLIILFILAACRTPIYSLLRSIGVPVMLSLFSRMLRFDTVAEWAKQRISRITQATAWNGQVDEEFDKLMDRHRKPKRASKKAESDKDDKEEDVAAASAAGDEQDNAEDDDPLPPVYSVMEWLATVPRHLYRTTPLWSLLSCYILLLSIGAPPPAGHRLLLGTYPTLHVALGCLGPISLDARVHNLSQPLLLIIVVLLSMTYGIETVSSHPNFLGYFSAIAGGTSHGHYHLLGDNLDQGQELPALKIWLLESGGVAGKIKGFTVNPGALVDEPAYLCYCGEDSPFARGIHARRLPARPHPECSVSMHEEFDYMPPRPSVDVCTPRSQAPLLLNSNSSDEGDFSVEGEGEDAATAEMNEEVVVEEEAVCSQSKDVAAQLARDVLLGHRQTSSSGRGNGRSMVSYDTEGSSSLEYDMQSLLLPGLYIIEANALHGLSSQLKGPWTDIAEYAYQALKHKQLHTTYLASPLRFGRLTAFLRKLRPIGSAGNSILVWRLTADEIEMVTEGEPAEVFPSAQLSPAVRSQQQQLLGSILQEVHEMYGDQRAEGQSRLPS